VQNKLEGYASDFLALTLSAPVTCSRFQIGQIRNRNGKKIKNKIKNKKKRGGDRETACRAVSGLSCRGPEMMVRSSSVSKSTLMMFVAPRSCRQRLPKAYGSATARSKKTLFFLFFAGLDPRRNYYR
jgi:hypothetical protein